MSTTDDIKILIADDHAFFRTGLIQIIHSRIGYQVIDESADGNDALAKTIALQPDLLILDIGMPFMNGIEVVKNMRFRDLPTPAIILSMHEEEMIIKEVLGAGAKGYLMKNINADELFKAIDTVVTQEKIYVPASYSTHLQQTMKQAMTDKKLQRQYSYFSEIELQVIRLMCKDLSSKEIADKLQLNTRTIEYHRASLLRKMNVRTAAGIVAYALSNKLA